MTSNHKEEPNSRKMRQNKTHLIKQRWIGLINLWYDCITQNQFTLISQILIAITVRAALAVTLNWTNIKIYFLFYAETEVTAITCSAKQYRWARNTHNVSLRAFVCWVMGLGLNTTVRWMRADKSQAASWHFSMVIWNVVDCFKASKNKVQGVSLVHYGRPVL